MKLAARTLFSLLLLAPLGGTFAYAQNSNVQHVIVVFQENRTPDNLFQDQNLTKAGADIVPPATGGHCDTYQIPLIPRPLADCYSPQHFHKSWTTMYHNGAMDGACRIVVNYGNGCEAGVPACSDHNYAHCPQYAYVDNSNLGIQPYWDIAETYGFANYMFQTSQGPSFPAHQFILSGTSAPTVTVTPYYTYFAAENMNNGNNLDAGCIASPDQSVNLIDPLGNEGVTMYPCFEHPTLTDLLEQYGITWRYYGDAAASIWTAPTAISHICGASGGNCMGSDWTGHVVVEKQNNLAPFLSDLGNCNLNQVTWVIPDGRWADHPLENQGWGPDWVADIVNGVGNSGCTNPDGTTYWNTTVILIAWDDWGGFYDHVSPQNTIGIGYSNNTGGQYVHGFRVPLLVVSPYVKLTNGQPGYISGLQPNPIYYDFGSILRFIEETFLPGAPAPYINPSYPYADELISNGADLSDFFNYGQGPRQFVPIKLGPYPTPPCDANCFINWQGQPMALDDDGTGP